MFYNKNVPGPERIVRILAGAMALVFAAMNWGDSAIAVGSGLMGFMLAMSGFVGYCPICHMAGRDPLEQ